MVKSNSIKSNSIEASNVYPNDQQQFRLNKIIETEDFFISEIKEK